MLLDEPTKRPGRGHAAGAGERHPGLRRVRAVISHDRWFLDRVATHILAFEGDSRVVWFEGNYQDYEADRKKRLGAEADQPHRIKYRPLVRGGEGREANRRAGCGSVGGGKKLLALFLTDGVGSIRGLATEREGIPGEAVLSRGPCAAERATVNTRTKASLILLVLGAAALQSFRPEL